MRSGSSGSSARHSWTQQAFTKFRSRGIDALHLSEDNRGSKDLAAPSAVLGAKAGVEAAARFTAIYWRFFTHVIARSMAPTAPEQRSTSFELT